MTTEAERGQAYAELQYPPSQGLDEIEASISAIEEAVLRSPARDREAIHELGCRIVAQALKNNDGSG